MIIKVTFGDYREYDYVYSPNNIGLKKENLKDNFYEWIDNTEDKYPFWCYENGEKVGLDFRGNAIVYWINKYLLINEYSKDKSYLIESFTDKSIDYDIKISL